MGRSTMIATAILALIVAARAGGGSPQRGDAGAAKADLSGWIHPGAKPAEEGHFETRRGGVLVDTSADQGQYSAEVPFHEVVRFYVEKSGFVPPNWSILGREVPGDQVNIPASWSQEMGEGKLVSMLHSIRRESASATLLVTDSGRGETICVTISRGLRDDRTLIQIVKHTRGRLSYPGRQRGPS